MDNSLKIGIIAGLVAGIVGGIISIFLGIYTLENSWVWAGLEALSFIPIREIVMVEIPLHIIWGIVLGVLFSRVYDLVPGKGISKGFIFGLIYCLVYPIRWLTFGLMYGYPSLVNSQLIYAVLFIPFGLVFGISYEFLSKRYVTRKEQLALIKYDLKSGFYPGAIAGIVSGVTSALAAWIVINPILYQRFSTDIEFQLSHMGTIVMFDMIWGIVFGILFAMFYDKVPKSGILKGVIFAITVFFFTNFQDSIRTLINYQIFKFEYEVFVLYIWGLLSGLSVFIPFGIVLGYLYKKPVEAPIEKQEKISTVQMANCIHCNATMLKGSKYCNECGKKQ